jgi:putative transposase
VTIAGANVHDTKLLAATLAAIVVERPQPTAEAPQHLCLDKGYDNPTGHATVAAYQYTPHIRRIGEERLDATGKQRYPARRWVVERTLACLSKCRGLLIR